MVAGPEILEKYVGSSERNLRQIFDHPPGIDKAIQNNYPNHVKILEQSALHVIGMVNTIPIRCILLSLLSYGCPFISV